jgi:lactam utilization protein B
MGLQMKTLYNFLISLFILTSSFAQPSGEQFRRSAVINGNSVEMCIHSIGIHADNEEALKFVKNFYKYIKDNNVELKNLKS